jgi:hypothetical protein
MNDWLAKVEKSTAKQRNQGRIKERRTVGEKDAEGRSADGIDLERYLKLYISTDVTLLEPKEGS